MYSHYFSYNYCSLLDQIREKVAAEGKPTDPYSDDTGAAFYRLPAGFRRAKKHQDKEEAGELCRQPTMLKQLLVHTVV